MNTTKTARPHHLERLAFGTANGGLSDKPRFRWSGSTLALGRSAVTTVSLPSGTHP